MSKWSVSIHFRFWAKVRNFHTLYFVIISINTIFLHCNLQLYNKSIQSTDITCMKQYSWTRNYWVTPMALNPNQTPLPSSNQEISTEDLNRYRLYVNQLHSHVNEVTFLVHFFFVITFCWISSFSILLLLMFLVKGFAICSMIKWFMFWDLF